MVNELIPMNIDDVQAKVKKFIVDDKHFKIFSIIDQAAEAQTANLTIPATRLIIFGNPKVGTLLMQQNDDITFELPIKVLLIAQGANHTKVIYRDPYDFAGHDQLASGGQQILHKMHNMYREMIAALQA
ncbi:MAG: DUF302 domain-containing protein [Candidatus Paralactobacillus gallistercoris]|uniref:DUF302 domain-containing protein n=1 Tax=Candidatus Paralactobacillus gallistercoris TaxID=2838724 RepID=A0A948X076_9LACO|nr:DUF302 domain-containing protein [Candidatus Paralactobacillus gallistercoris]